MNTWNAEDPPVLDPPTLAGRIAGIFRVAALIVVTLIAVGLFLLGRALRGLLGRWVVFHFGVARVWSRICLRLTGLRLVVQGTPIRSGSLIANHSSWIDILALRSVRLIYFVSKAEVASWPGVGFITRITGTVFIERRRSEAKRQEAVLRERIAHDQLLCFFPEGTSTDGLRVLVFKSSLFSAFFWDGTGTDIQLQPVSVRFRPAPGSGLPASFYGWWGDMGFESHIWDVVTRSFGGVAEVIFHAPVSASEFADRKALADYCQRVVEQGVIGASPAPEALLASETETA
jgi:1-acyl-sn-glycerol-3-phosphate acyltransferase